MAKGGALIDGTLLLMAALLVVLGVMAHRAGGIAEVESGLRGGSELLLRFGPVVILSFLAAGFAERLVPDEWVRAQLGREAGMRGILLASAAGVATPAGPFVSMPIAAVMIRSGAGPGAVVAFLSAWSLLSLHRFVAWEVPILGWQFALLRYSACIVLPILAGVMTRWLVR